MRQLCVGIRVLISLPLVLSSSSMLSCSSEGDGDEDSAPVATSPPVTATPGSLNLTGNYRGTFVSTVVQATGTVAIQFFQAAGNGTVTGTITFTGSPCFRAGTVVGTLTGGTFDGLVNFGGSIQITLLAMVTSDGLSASGGYAVNMNSTGCSRDQGQFTIVRQT